MGAKIRMFWCLSLSFIFPCSKPSHPAACFPFLQIQSCCSSYKKANIHVHCEITTAVKFIDMSMIYILTTFLVRKTRNLCSQHSFKYVTCCRYVWSPHSTSEFQNLLIPLYWNLRYHFTNTFSLPSSLATLTLPLAFMTWTFLDCEIRQYLPLCVLIFSRFIHVVNGRI